jgi:hypothetical protein
MPIYPLLTREGFAPDRAATISHVFEDVLLTFGLVDREDPLTKLIAQKMIEIAQTGEKDPARLKQLTLEAFKERPN